MKKILSALACGLVIGLSASSANALTIGDSNYIGHIDDGIPSSEALEVTYINSLLDLAAGAAATPCSQAATETCDRLLSSLNVTGFADATLTGAVKNETGTNTVNVTGFEYIIAKYDASNPGAGSYVWYVGGLTGNQTLPSTAGGYGLSHYTLFNSTTAVPDGGATLGLLGLSMLGLAYLRRRIA